MSLIYLTAAILFTATAHVLFKLYFLRKNYAYLILSAGFLCATPPMSFLALRELPLSIVYMSTALTYVLVLILARVVLNEYISRRQLLSTMLIMVGVITFNLKLFAA
jgi:multidrug transporter EmrE-like cation transporter